jgi:Uma2 family endonuclease
VSELARKRFTFDEYVSLEDASPIKHELLDGVVYPMAGGSPEHAAVCANVIHLLMAALEGKKCRVHTTDLRIRVLASGLATYPDASVVCGRVELDPDDRLGHTATNPTLVVEVLSPSTEGYDRGEKLASYKPIPALREVMLVAHDERRVDLWRRTDRGWTQLVFGEGERVALESVGAELPVERIYFDPLA